MTIIYWAAGWLFGIWLGSALALPTPLWAVCGVLCLLAAQQARRKPVPLALLVAFTALSFGAARYNLSRPVFDQSHIVHYAGADDVVITGLVGRSPDVRDAFQNLTVDVETAAAGGRPSQPATGRVLVRAPRFPLVGYGTRVQIQGDLAEPQSAGDFDYRGYLARSHIHATITYPQITVLAIGRGNPVVHALLAFQSRMQTTIERLLPQPQAALLSGILLGAEERLTGELRADFRDTGMTHIIAISGFNVAIIAGALLQGGRHLAGNRRAAWVAIGGIGLYTIFVGAEASVVRAAVMAVLFVIAANLLGRPTFAPAALFAAAFFMTLADPDLLWDIGFQLSFAATLGLMLYVGPWSQSLRAVWPQQFGAETGSAAFRFFTEIFLATAVAMIMTQPLLAYHFGSFSLVSPLANLLILPAQPGVMTWGGIAALAGLVSPMLGQVPAWFAWLFLSYTIELVQFFAALPLATVPVAVSAEVVAVSYAFMLGAGWLAWARPDGLIAEAGVRLSRRARRPALLALLFMALLAIARAWSQPDGRLHVAFLDVGQGDATLIHTPDGRQILVDGGAYPSLLLSRVGEQLPFWDKTIDLVVATHPDTDHVAGLVDLFSHYEVGQVLTNGAGGDASPGFQALLQAAEQQGTPVHTAVAGETIEFGTAVQLTVLHPDGTAGERDDNDHSLVMRLCYDGFSLLLTGDAGETAEQTMLAGGKPLQSTVLKASHHGSRTGSSRQFLRAVKPQIAIISVGGDNRFGHPHADTVQRLVEAGATIWRTDELGTIELASDGRQIWSSAAKN